MFPKEASQFTPNLQCRIDSAPRARNAGVRFNSDEAFKTRIRRCETSHDFAPEAELAAPEPSAL